MDCATFGTDLGDLVDDGLDPVRGAALAAHLAGCAACRATLAELTAVRDAARRLGPLEPPAALFPRLAAAVAADRRADRGANGSADRPPLAALAPVAHTSVPPSRRGPAVADARRPRRWQPLAAAAALALTAGGLGWLGMRLTPVADIRTAQVVPGGVHTQRPPVETTLQLAEAHYLDTIDGLEQITRAERSQLDAQTAAVVQANLTLLDQAIGESREALRSQPGSELALDSLMGALRSKVTLLQDTVTLIGAMSADVPVSQ